MKELNWKALATTLGTISGVYMFVAAIMEMYAISTLWFSPEAFSMLASIYPGLSASIVGAFIGLLWGLFCGALCGAVIAGLYNWFSERFE